jgi:hypothetical protein
MAMIHSRPGFQARVTHEGKRAPPPAKVTPDMQPALAKRSSPADGIVKSPLKDATPVTATPEYMQAQAEAAWARMQAAKPKVSPEIIVNPKPSATPIMTSPHEDDLLT